MKKQITKRLQLSKETLRNLSERDLQGAVGGFVIFETRRSDCICITLGDSCPPTWPDCH